MIAFIFHPEIINISFVFSGKMDLDVSINPWIVSSFEEFHFYCCPECDIKTKEKGQLYEHAVQEHQLAKDTLIKRKVKIEAPEIAEESVKDQTEFADVESSADHKKSNCAVHLDNMNQDRDPLATKVSEIIPVDLLKVEIKEEPKETPKIFIQDGIEDTEEQSSFSSRYNFDNPLFDSVTPDLVKSEPTNKKKKKRTQNVKTKVQKCLHCSFESELPRIFKQHTNSIRICTVCNETFCGTRSAQNYKIHLKTHKPKKVLDCEKCNKSFKFPSQLKSHLLWCGKQPNTNLDTRYSAFAH